MSGLLGFVAFSGAPVPERAFQHARTMLSHHGPSAGHLTDGPIALAMAGCHNARGRPADRAGERLGEFAIVADAVLDNRHTLSSALGLNHAEAAQVTDSALILRAYAAWGAACLNRLEGDFAFAITHVESRETFLARDHIGARPLYVSRNLENLAFSSDINALLSFEHVDGSIDETCVARHLSRPDEPLETPFFRGIETLPPGHVARHTANGETRWAWWDASAVPARSFPSGAALAEETRAAVTAAVRASADVKAPFGAHLSGGIDSTTIAGLAAQYDLKATYSWSPEISQVHPRAAGRDERTLIEKLTAGWAAPHHYGSATAESFYSFLDDPIELTGVADLADEAPVQKAAAEDGIGTMLSGWGGDEAFSALGIGYMAYLLRKGRLGGAVSAARHRGGGLRRPRAVGHVLWQDGVVPLLPRGLYNRFSQFQNPFQNNGFINRQLKADAIDTAQEDRLRPRVEANPIAFLAALIKRGHIAMRMEHWAASGAHHGLTYRYPLTARPVLEVILGASPEFVFGNGTPRALCRAAFPDLGLDRCRKFDPANEALRAEVKRGCWAMLARDVRDGRFDAPCDWIDGAALRKAIQAVPTRLTPQDALIFAEITAAVRVWTLFERQSVRGRRPNPELNASRVSVNGIRGAER